MEVLRIGQRTRSVSVSTRSRCHDAKAWLYDTYIYIHVLCCMFWAGNVNTWNNGGRFQVLMWRQTDEDVTIELAFRSDVLGLAVSKER